MSSDATSAFSCSMLAGSAAGTFRLVAFLSATSLLPTAAWTGDGKGGTSAGSCLAVQARQSPPPPTVQPQHENHHHQQQRQPQPQQHP